jgi:hypothetical protein
MELHPYSVDPWADEWFTVDTAKLARIDWAV